MKLKPLIPILALGLVPLIHGNDIEPTKEFYTAPFTTAPITLDGNLSEWGGVSVIADPRFAIPKGSGAGGTYVLFEEYAGGTWSGPEDQTSAVQVVYDADNVYFGFVVTDDYHENAANSAWNGDSVQLMIANGDRNQQIALYNYALGGIEGETGEVVLMHEAGPGGDPVCDCATEAVITRDATTKKTVYEIRLPKAALGLTELTPGTKFGLGMAINDGDDGEGQGGQKGWGGLGAHALVFGKSPNETALVTLAANETTIEILGIGAESLIGGDLTDPENDGNEEAGETDPSWNWAGITSSIEPGFGGGEFSFNIFDNLVGGGNDKWCCDDPTEANPHWVAVQFANPVSLTHFTITSGNDAADRDPTKFQIQGSSDGSNYTPIYTFDSETVPWTDRNQVVKFTLATPSAPYRYIRYFVTETPGTLHQINEIEYFGTFGGSATAFLSAINSTIQGFSFRVNDTASSIVDPTSVKLTLDGAPVTFPTPVKADGVIDVSFTPAAPFQPSSEHTYTIEARDGVGNVITSTGTFRTPAYALFTPADKVTPDATKPGFIFRVHQNPANTATTTARALAQLAGTLGQNFADPNALGAALDVATPGATDQLPITFEIPTVINMDQDGVGQGEITPDDLIPGIPGLSETGPTDGIAAEITTYIELTPGLHTLIVNRDDGFLTTAGDINDVFRAKFAGEFNAGGGAADTAYTVFVPESGVYPFRTVYFEGGGGANLEWKIVKADGTRALLNDEANGGPKTYRAITGAQSAAISFVTPSINSSNVNLSTPISAQITDPSGVVAVDSVKLSLDGTEVNATATKAGNVISISFQPSTMFASGSQHTASLSYTASGTTRTESWNFTVETYPTLGPELKALSFEAGSPGFLWRVFQNEAVQHTVLAQTELALAGLLTNIDGVLPNLADPNAIGVAADVGVTDGPLIKFEIPGVLNVSQFEGDANGNFQPDGQMPGIPGTTGANNGIDAEIRTFVEFPAGLITMGVNSDDGFRTQAGYINVPADGVVLGQFEGGRGASDTIFKFVVQEAGVYPMRTIWQEGGGGANIEWFTVKADGTKVLLNDLDNGGLKTYRAGVAPNKPVTVEFPINIAVTGGQIELSWTEPGVVLQESTDLVNWTDLTTATSPHRPTTTGRAAVFYRLKR